MTSLDTREFRNALGTFATGITVITSTQKNGDPVGLTVNSFASVSLDPALVLWCLDNNAESYNAFSECEHFAIHVLHQGQEEISNRFANKTIDKFADLAWNPSENGIPLLDDFGTVFECATENIHEGGDHIILLGRVIKFEVRNESSPLIFHRGGYQSLTNS